MAKPRLSEWNKKQVSTLRSNVASPNHDRFLLPSLVLLLIVYIVLTNIFIA